METLVEHETTRKRVRRLVTYSWDEYLQVISMMDDGNQILDDFEVRPDPSDGSDSNSPGKCR